MDKTFNVINFGCRATQADGAAIERALLNLDLRKSVRWQRSDVVVINTCTVTNTADVEARQVIRRVHRENPTAKIVVTGCYAQRAPQELARIQGVTCVIGNSHKERLAPILAANYLATAPFPILQEQTRVEGADVFCSSIFESRQLRVIADATGAGRTRPVLKVQDGCSYRCSYCIIPSVRGDSRSLPAAEVMRQVGLLLDQGFREITLTGIHLGGYGRDSSPQETLAQLARRLLKEERLERLRLSSIEPLEYTDELIDLVAESPRMAKHFHVPLQSGSDRILRMMRRPYLAEYYVCLVAKMRQRVPDAAIGADVMVGFPTETDADHANTQALLETSPMTYLHVFPYSLRPGTASANLRPEVRGEIAQQRGRELRELAARKNREFRSSFVGKPLSVITLGQSGEEPTVEAVSSNYLKVEISNGAVASNQILSARITELTAEGLRGEVAQPAIAQAKSAAPLEPAQAAADPG
ncbi:MAG: tRNA (N(6)-L-threonylcarbamoyladenosine(37)-C(2))-methylthiotransferase MtaB [Acidobacteria bacterium]|nr:tRNA (N(6)-L-threonylcarbamoyladenosine(37)-C(2))-methylthiotransferase MtaB [Acidobacteriota bacterium]MCI0720460.1 tRNA (N(6)-L-threonylcarbamoyladenosine(37)-C(2))-methylthiotransferase MtaB [Acidobacteriota bacterium]